ncbi:MAG TPA: hypothetical protein VFG09_11170 [Thermodesulfovibrionales bacterium]|nr:hypothetical protein [Thermodesulfovibrionales bacterium]
MPLLFLEGRLDIIHELRGPVSEKLSGAEGIIKGPVYLKDPVQLRETEDLLNPLGNADQFQSAAIGERSFLTGCFFVVVNFKLKDKILRRKRWFRGK